MPRTLVALTEIADAIGSLPQIDVGGTPHVDSDQLALALAPLVGTLQVGSPVAIPLVDGIPDGSTFTNLHSLPDAEWEAERQRLALLPPGPCVCARRRPDDDPKAHTHPAGDCRGCDGTSQPCPFEEYVDSTVRDPGDARMSRPQGPVEIPPHPGSEPIIDAFRRPPANANEFRPPGG